MYTSTQPIIVVIFFKPHQYWSVNTNIVFAVSVWVLRHVCVATEVCLWEHWSLCMRCVHVWERGVWGFGFAWPSWALCRLCWVNRMFVQCRKVLTCIHHTHIHKKSCLPFCMCMCMHAHTREDRHEQAWTALSFTNFAACSLSYTHSHLHTHIPHPPHTHSLYCLGAKCHFT